MRSNLPYCPEALHPRKRNLVPWKRARTTNLSEGTPLSRLLASKPAPLHFATHLNMVRSSCPLKTAEQMLFYLCPPFLCCFEVPVLTETAIYVFGLAVKGNTSVRGLRMMESVRVCSFLHLPCLVYGYAG